MNRTYLPAHMTTLLSEIAEGFIKDKYSCNCELVIHIDEKNHCPTASMLVGSQSCPRGCITHRLFDRLEARCRDLKL